MAAAMTAETYQTMADVRAAIDTLDDELVKLLGLRLAAIRRASELKEGIAQARVPWRVEEVAARVRERAADVGFDPDTAERIWRAMVEECIAFEERALAGRGGLRR
jgi:isochorismate pyruvate lyase